MSEDRHPATIPEMLRGVVGRRGANAAILTGAARLDYVDLDAETMAIARALVALGAGKGSRIALLAPDGPFWLTLFLAAMRIGAIVTPISTLCSPAELAHILRHSDVQMLVAVRRFLRHDYAARLAEALPSLEGRNAPLLHLEEAPFLRSIWLDDADGLGWARSHEELRAAAQRDDAPPEAIVRAIEEQVFPSDDAIMIYTSGSTALPKAVVHIQRAVTQHPRLLAEHFLIGSHSRLMPLLPLFWIGGLAMALEVLQAGGTLVYPPSPDFAAVLDTIERFGVTQINSWGPQLLRLREAAAERGIDVGSIIGLAPQSANGETIPLDRTANMLGMTESFGPHSSEPLNTLLPEHLRGSSGRALGGIERRIVDLETGEVLGPGQAGELQLRGGALMRGFYKMEAADVFTPDGFYPTHDIARIEEDGNLYFQARRGDMLKVSGANVSRVEVEAALRKLPGIDIPIVVGLPHPQGGSVLVAAVVPAQGANPGEEELRGALRVHLSGFKIPRRILIIAPDEVAWTPSNKIRLDVMTRLIVSRLPEGWLDD
jgi:acyl-CoA synthetase (AMP-forming)/AMP-acid ligase II